MMLITGATGRVGRALVFKLIGKKEYRGKVRILVRDMEAANALFGSAVKAFKADLCSPRDFPTLENACMGVDTIVHCAAQVDYSIDEEEMMLANFMGTAQLLKAARLQKKRPRFIYISSTSIYRGSGHGIDENTKPHPFNAYGKSKLEAERAIRDSGLDYIILRPPIVYGKGFTTGFSLVVRLIRKGQMFILGSGSNYIPHIHLSDLVDALILALKSKLRKGEFNISSGEKVTQEESYRIIAGDLGVAPPKIHIPKRIAYIAAGIGHALYMMVGRKPKIYKEYVHTLAESRVFNIERAERMLHYRPKVKFREGILEMISGLDK
ncbi:MAG TPA: NAD-dependent epimerase/dehydratase family protein [Candidatus Norongarragalinales archaeon]|nr:NAD-dependent epimerase/dehydratase family protein [Candidatus Norongarragalinales archaeon]